MGCQIEYLIEARAKDIGDGFMVRRSLPYAKKRLVGPFIFWDHMGPVPMQPDFKLTVRAHPHIGLSTLTYLFAGEIMHRDSLGYELAIRPGAVNWMTAGSGIVHSERASYSSDFDRLEGIQLWVALPKEKEDMDPSFQHVPESELPRFTTDTNEWTLIAGQYEQWQSPVNVQSPLFYLASDLDAGANVQLNFSKGHEVAVYVAAGEVELAGQAVRSGALAILEKDSEVLFTAKDHSKVLIFGGEPFPEKRFIWWNLVSASEEKIEAAKVRWKNQDFPKVKNETEFIPLPEK